VVAVRHQDVLALHDRESFLKELFNEQPTLFDDEDAK
jgi:hypothetical protein